MTQRVYHQLHRVDAGVMNDLGYLRTSIFIDDNRLQIDLHLARRARLYQSTPADVDSESLSVWLLLLCYLDVMYFLALVIYTIIRAAQGFSIS